MFGCTRKKANKSLSKNETKPQAVANIYVGGGPPRGGASAGPSLKPGNLSDGSSGFHGGTGEIKSKDSKDKSKKSRRPTSRKSRKSQRPVKKSQRPVPPEAKAAALQQSKEVKSAGTLGGKSSTKKQSEEDIPADDVTRENNNNQNKDAVKKSKELAKPKIDEREVSSIEMLIY